MQDTIRINIEKLQSHSGKIVITTHHKPDGDAMGSSLGLYNYLKKVGIVSMVITPTDYAHFLHWLPGNEDVLVYEGNEGEADAYIAAAEIVFCLDFNSIKRINTMGPKVINSGAEIVLIDHHRDPEDFDSMRFCDHHSSSTCQLMYDFITSHLSADAIDAAVAQCLYTGIITDTGSFRYDSTNVGTLKIAGELMERGAKPAEIYDQVFDQNELSRLKLLGYFLYNKIELIEGGRVALATLNSEELIQFSIKTGDTEGFVNYGLSLKGVEMSALIVDRTQLVKMSFRSKGSFACNDFAAQFFNGGGHKNAAGGSSMDSLENTIQRFKDVIGPFLK